MKFRQLGIIVILFGFVVGAVSGCQQQPAPGTFTDDLGREVTLAQIPQRIVSHVPAITETLFALGLGEKIVGVSDYCDYPAEAREKPSVGNYFNPSIESIIAQDPDLVLTDGYSEGLILQLDNLGVAGVVLRPEDITGIMKDIELLGRIAGVEEKATELVVAMTSRLTEVDSRTKSIPRVRVFYVFDATDLDYPWTAGPGSFAHSLITLAGGQNIAAEAHGDWVQFGIETLLDADPEVILVDTSHGTAVVSVEALQAHPAWREITAVQQGSIYTIDGDLVNRPGPRIVQGLEEIARSINPELFE